MSTVFKLKIISFNKFLVKILKNIFKKVYNLLEFYMFFTGGSTLFNKNSIHHI